MAIKKPLIKNEVNQRENLKTNQLRINFNQKRNEIISRLFSNKNELNYIKEIMHNSHSEYEFFFKFVTRFDKDNLFYLGLFDREKIELFNLVYNLDKKSQQILNTSFKNHINNKEIKYYNNKFNNFIVENNQYNLNENDLLVYSDNKNAEKVSCCILPNIYIFGNEDDFNMFDMMSFDANKVKIINNIKTLEDFEKDKDDKVIILTVNANELISDKYNEIFDRQDFLTFRTFTFDNDENMDKFYLSKINRKYITDKIIERMNERK